MNKWPRIWANEIGKLKHLEDRQKALEEVPPQFQQLVKEYLKLKWERRDASHR